MKKMCFVFALATSLLINPLFADPTSLTGDASNTPPAATKPNGPCRSIVAACNFSKGDTQGKGLWKDCLNPILNGGMVQGVTVDPASIPACKAKVATRRAAKDAAKAAGAATGTTNAPAPGPGMIPATPDSSSAPAPAN